MDLSASRPTRFMSSPCPAIPMTRVEKMMGTMMDLIMRRKVVESGRSSCATSGNRQPISTPTAMPIRIHLVNEIRLSHAHIASPELLEYPLAVVGRTACTAGITRLLGAWFPYGDDRPGTTGTCGRRLMRATQALLAAAVEIS